MFNDFVHGALYSQTHSQLVTVWLVAILGNCAYVLLGQKFDSAVVYHAIDR
jgi:hypothetical protein